MKGPEKLVIPCKYYNRKVDSLGFKIEKAESQEYQTKKVTMIPLPNYRMTRCNTIPTVLLGLYYSFSLTSSREESLQKICSLTMKK